MDDGTYEFENIDSSFERAGSSHESGYTYMTLLSTALMTTISVARVLGAGCDVRRAHLDWGLGSARGFAALGVVPAVVVERPGVRLVGAQGALKLAHALLGGAH